MDKKKPAPAKRPVDSRKAFAAATAAGAAAAAAAERLSDLTLLGGLAFTAATVVAFAGYETMFNDHNPKVNGMEYLAIFAQPSRRAEAVATERMLDMTPLGALSSATSEPNAGYSLVSAQTGLAFLRAGNRIFSVNPGDDVPRLGHVAAVAPRDGRWALIGDRGETLIAGAQFEIGHASGGHFDKRMIFGEAR